MIVIYRISDGGNPKDKPEYVTKKGVFQHFCKIFNNHIIIVIGDNISDDTHNFLLNYIQQDRIIKTQLGNDLDTHEHIAGLNLFDSLSGAVTGKTGAPFVAP